MRKELESDKYVTELELNARPLGERLRVFLIRPFQLLFLEPIVLFLSIYMSVLYGLLYMFFVAYPVVYQEGKGYSAGITGLMFIPIAVGVVCSAVCAPWVNKHYLALVHKHNGKPPAEARLIPMMVSIPMHRATDAQSLMAHRSHAGLFPLACSSSHGPPIRTFPGLGRRWAGSLLDSVSYFCTTRRTITWWTAINIKRRQHWQQRHSCDHSGALRLCYSRSRCSTRLGINGLDLCWRSSRWLAAQFRLCFTSRARRYGGIRTTRTLETRRIIRTGPNNRTGACYWG